MDQVQESEHPAFLPRDTLSYEFVYPHWRTNFASVFLRKIIVLVFMTLSSSLLIQHTITLLAIDSLVCLEIDSVWAEGTVDDRIMPVDWHLKRNVDTNEDITRTEFQE